MVWLVTMYSVTSFLWRFGTICRYVQADNQVQVVVEHPAEPDYPTQCNTIIRKQNRVQLLAQAQLLVAPPRPEHLKGQPTQPVT